MARGWTGIVWLLAALLLVPITARAGTGHAALPRFAALKRELTNARVGPGLGYPVRWRYEKAGLPVEITETYGSWRRIRDSGGQGGWVNAAMLRPVRNALVNPWLATSLPLRARAAADASKLALLRPNVLLRVRSCDLAWCKVQVTGHGVSGYVRQALLWGVYPNEVIRANSLWAAIRAMI